MGTLEKPQSFEKRNSALPTLAGRAATVAKLTAGWKRTSLALLLFGISFGYVEAAVVDYLRLLPIPMSAGSDPQRLPDDLFPLLTLDQLNAAGPQFVRLLKTEVVREAATLVMLGAAALLASGNARTWLAAFVVAFGVWDISFYAFLKVLLGWPRSWLTWDLLFLIPVPWVGPVVAPVAVSLTMIAAGLVILRRESEGRPAHFDRLHWLGIVAGGVIIVLAFTWDYRNIMAAGMPKSFNWPLFVLGEAVGLAAFAHGVRRTDRRV